MKTLILPLLLPLLLSAVVAGCSDDDELDGGTLSSRVGEARQELTGSQVLDVHVSMAGQDMTHLPEGCPALFEFEWVGDELELRLVDFSVAAMPVSISFSCRVAFTSPDQWDVQDLPKGEWVKFSGENGSTAMSGGQAKQAEGSSVKGFYDVDGEQLLFEIDFNLMGVNLRCPRQELDPDEDYAEEREEYERDLAEWKKANVKS